MKTFDWDSASGLGVQLLGLVRLDFGIRLGARIVKRNFGGEGNERVVIWLNAIAFFSARTMEGAFPPPSSTFRWSRTGEEF